MNNLFDDISRGLASRTPRRQILRLIVSGLAGAALPTLWSKPAAAQQTTSCCTFPRLAMCVSNADRTSCEAAGGSWQAGGICCGQSCYLPSVTTGCCFAAGGCVDGMGESQCVNCHRGTFSFGKCCMGTCCNGDCCTDGTCCTGGTTCKPGGGGCCPACPGNSSGRVSATRSGPPAQADITVQNAVDGIATITIAKAVNCTVAIPAAGGTKNPIVCTATKIDQTKAAQIVLRACTPDGCCCPVDPIFTTLKITTGRWVRQTFTDIPRAESFIGVTNGELGLKKVRIQVNGVHYKTLRLHDNETAAIDVATAMEPGDNNTISLTGMGELGSSAEVQIVDTPLDVTTGKGGRRSIGAQGQTRRHNSVWGNLAEETEESSDLHSALSSTQTVNITFSGLLNTQSIAHPGLYTVEVNGNRSRIQGVVASQTSSETVLTLRLAPRTLQAGDKVDVYWDELPSVRGRSLEGHVRLIAEPLH